MGFHHVAFATKDLEATHRFYTESMGFTLVKSSVAPTDAPGGWAKHVFYDTGGQGLIAFWELHDERMADFDPAISLGLGLQPWVNHIAFFSPGMDDIRARLGRWLDRGHDVMEIDHGWCHSIYTMDPNRVLVEFCTDTAARTEEDRIEALRVITAAKDDLVLEDMRVPTFHKATAKV